MTDTDRIIAAIGLQTAAISRIGMLIGIGMTNQQETQDIAIDQIEAITRIVSAIGELRNANDKSL